MILRFCWLILALMVSFHAVAIGNASTEGPLFPAACPERYPQTSLTLDNGLRVLLITDPRATLAQASLDVSVGFRDDPDSRPGMAHFVEHMLFLGSAAYPQAGSYKAFIAQHQGEANASTDYGHTNYYLRVLASALPEALDRLADQFRAPLFEPRYVELERKAIQAEFMYRKDLQYWRLRDLSNQVLGGDDYPATRFGMGNADSLAGDPTTLASEAHDWFNRHYQAERMALVVRGPQPLSELQTLVTTRFESIPGRSGTAAPTAASAVMDTSRLPLVAHVALGKKMRYVRLQFPVDARLIRHPAAAAEFVSFLLTQARPGTFADDLRKQEYGDAPEVGFSVYSEREALIEIDVDTWYQGTEYYWEVARRLFAYTALLRAEPIEEWRFRDFLALQSLEWCHGPAPAVKDVAEQLNRLGPAYAQAAGHVADSFEPEVYRDILRAIRPDNMLLTVVHPHSGGDEESPWFGTVFQQDPLTPEEVAHYQPKGDYGFQLPGPNPFIIPPGKLPDASNPVIMAPRLISTDPRYAAWFARDTRFADPKSYLYIQLRSPEIDSSPLSSALNRLLVDLLEWNLAEVMAEASEAGSTLEVEDLTQGIGLYLSGYPESIDRLLEEVLAQLSHFRVKEEDLRGYAYGWRQHLKEPERQHPLRRSRALLYRAMVQPSYSNEALMGGYRGASYARLIGHLQAVQSSLDVKMLAAGNLELYHAVKWRDRVRTQWVRGFSAEPVAPRAVRLPAGLHRYVESTNYDDSVVRFHIQGGARSPAEQARFDLLESIAVAAFYHELRSEQQQGYVVEAEKLSYEDVPGLSFVLQSPVSSGEALELRIRFFLRTFDDRLQRFSETEFATYRDNLLGRLEAPPKSLHDVVQSQWQNIRMGYLESDRRQQIAEAVREITLSEFRSWYRDRFLSPEARQLSLLLEGQVHAINPDWQSREAASFRRELSELGADAF